MIYFGTLLRISLIATIVAPLMAAFPSRCTNDKPQLVIDGDIPVTSEFDVNPFNEFDVNLHFTVDKKATQQDACLTKSCANKCERYSTFPKYVSEYNTCLADCKGTGYPFFKQKQIGAKYCCK